MLKLGVIGTNFVSSWLCEAARRLGSVTLFSVYSRTAEKGRAFADAEGIMQVYTDLDAFFSSGIEAVYMASPTCCHFQMAKAALDAGLHVLLEKPMVTKKSEFEALSALARERGVILMEAMRPLHDPAFSFVKSELEKIGTLRRVSFEFCQYSSRYDAFRKGEILNAFNPEISGAALLDIGIYPLCWATALFGAPDSVFGAASFLDNGFEGGGVILLGYRGFQVSVTYSKVASSVTESAIVGEDGAITIDHMTSPKRIVRRERGKLSHSSVVYENSCDNNLIYELSDFVRLCEKGGENAYLLKSAILYETLERVMAAMGLVLPI